MSTSRHFQMSQSEYLEVQGIQPFCSTQYGHLSLTDALSSFQQVKIESSSLCHHPTVIVALNRTIRDGSSYVSCLTPIPEECLVERDWFIVNH